MQHDVLIDGAQAQGSWLKERAFQFGDGLFETVAILDGMPCHWAAHMERLGEGCQRIRLPLPDFGLLAEEGQRLCVGHRRAVLKIFWTAGRTERGYRRPDDIHPQRILRRSEWPQKAAGWSALRQCDHRLGENPTLAGIKHLNRLDQVVARSEWKDARTGEGLMLGQDGRVVSGTMSNIFVQRGQTLLTPAIDGAGIAGVVRALILKTGENVGAPVLVDAVSLDDVRGADALFLSNSLIGVVRVSRFESIEYDPGIRQHAVISETRRLCHQSRSWHASDE
jgi:4-amino-4-deoxychorismate lyase